MVRNAQFRAYAPVRQTSSQRCTRISCSYPHETIIDTLGNQIVQVTFATFPPYSSKVVSISADLLLAESPQRQAEPTLQDYLQAAPCIESDHPEIRSLANELLDKSTLETIRATGDWVASHLAYSGYVRQVRGALYALNHRRGDCTEYSYLFVALCRANSIPARAVGGYICHESSVLKPGSYHDWGEFYDGKAWRIVDGENMLPDVDPSRYVAMHIIRKAATDQFHRFMVTGEGLEGQMDS